MDAFSRYKQVQQGLVEFGQDWSKFKLDIYYYHQPIASNACL